MINTKRLQVVLDEMALWEREIFEKEYADMNWYKGKQAKHVKEMEDARKRSKLGTSLLPSIELRNLTPAPNVVLTKQQRAIFDKVEAFIMKSRKANTPSQYRAARLAFNNTFPARERAFITKLAEELHLTVRWDEYDENDNNLVTLRLPGTGSAEASNEATPREGTPAVDDDGEWEDVDDEESNAAIDRVLKKYFKAPVEDPDAEGTFDERHERSVKEKMDEWKRAYYKVSYHLVCLRVRSFLTYSWNFYFFAGEIGDFV